MNFRGPSHMPFLRFVTFAIFFGFVYGNVCNLTNIIALFPDEQITEKIGFGDSSFILKCARRALLEQSTLDLVLTDNSFQCMNGKESKGSITMHRTRWPQRLAGACSDHRCHPGSSCVPLSAGYVCKDEQSCEGDSSINDVNSQHCPQVSSPEPGEPVPNYDCTAVQLELYPHIAAIPSSGHLHVFNFSKDIFEVFRAKVNVDNLLYVVDFKRCKLIFGMGSSIMDFNLQTMTDFHSYAQKGVVKGPMRFFAEENILIYMTGVRKKTIWLSRNYGEKKSTLYRTKKQVYDIAIHNRITYILKKRHIVKKPGSKIQMVTSKSLIPLRLNVTDDKVLVAFAFGKKLKLYDVLKKRQISHNIKTQIIDVYFTNSGYTLVLFENQSMGMYSDDLQKHVKDIPLSIFAGNKVFLYVDRMRGTYEYNDTTNALSYSPP